MRNDTISSAQQPSSSNVTTTAVVVTAAGYRSRRAIGYGGWLLD